MKQRPSFLSGCLLASFAASTVFSAHAQESKKIEDNSFLIEEAYNQEDGVIQYIQTFQYSHKSKEWLYTFTNELPFHGQQHQLSYTVPLARVGGDDAFHSGIGDVALNYRYQLLANDKLAVAPRLSLILPTGDYKKGLGQGAMGYQVNLPISWELTDKWISHWNAGATYTPKAREASGLKADLRGYNYGASIIHLQSETFNFMLEGVKTASQGLSADGSKAWDSAAFIIPGFRAAINHASGWQVVYGVGLPIGIGSSRGDNGVFLYLSFEK
ncbi:MAG: transporter [Aquabacterium sp.]|nr:transporter [Aquabacterium sp.]